MAAKAKKVKRTARQKTKIRIRKKISGSNAKPRLSVFKSSKHTYAQAISDEKGATFVSASTKDKEVLDTLATLKVEDAHSDHKSTKSVLAARAVGRVIGQRLLEKSIEVVVFDRGGYQYLGRVQAVADGARDAGLKF